MKRLIGQKSENENVQKDMEGMMYDVIDDHGYPKILIDDLELSPDDIYYYILEHIKQLCDRRLDCDVSDVVVSVPTRFGIKQREATRTAAKHAGFTSVTLINEPTAAFLAHKNLTKTRYNDYALAYDFGGGTFDVSIIKIRNGIDTLVCSDGDCYLGGKDIDNILVKYIQNEMLNKYTHPLNKEDLKKKFDDKTNQKGNLKHFSRLRSACEEAKQVLSHMDHFTFNFDVYGIDIDIDITKEKFENLIRDLITRTIEIVEKCIRTAKLTKDDITCVIPIGGSCRIPLVIKTLEKFFGKSKIYSSQNVDTLVGIGTAIYSQYLQGDHKQPMFWDILSHSLGTDVKNNQLSVILKRNSQLPTKSTKEYKLLFDDQTEMRITILQGDNKIASNNYVIGNLVISNFSKRVNVKTVIHVTYEVDCSGILKVSAIEFGSDNSKELRIDLNSTPIRN